MTIVIMLRMPRLTRNKSRSSDFDRVDEAMSYCRNIEAIGQLLGGCVQQNGSLVVQSTLIAQAGWMIADEAQKLRSLLKRLHAESGGD